MARFTPRPLRSPLHQAGVAAIEFALIAMLMLLMLLGSLVYWRVLQAQQSVSRATGDGARMVQNLIYGSLTAYDITHEAQTHAIQAVAADVIKRSLQNSGIPGNPQQATSVTLSVNTTEARLNVSYQLPPMFGSTGEQPQPIRLGGWAVVEPARLQASSLVSFQLDSRSTP